MSSGAKFLCASSSCRGDEGLAAGSRTVYRRYLTKFICVIPRVHGGYFKSSSRVIQREFIRKDCNSSWLTADRSKSRARGRSRTSERIDSRSQCHSAARTVTASLGLRLKMECFSVGGCIGLPRVASGCCFGSEAILKTVLARLEQPPGVVWSEAILKTALACLEQPLRVSFCRNRNKFIRRCSSWSRIGKSSSNNNDGHNRSLWRRKEEQGLLR